MTPSNADIELDAILSDLLNGKLWTSAAQRKILALFQAREQQLLSELLGELPKKIGSGARTGHDYVIDQVVSVIERYREEL